MMDNRDYEKALDKCWNKFCESKPTLSKQAGVLTLFNFIFDYLYPIKKHNLTSDAEGEEMLTVPRKKVQEKWQRAYEQEEKYSRAQDSPVAREELYYNRGIMSIIDTLFGSKCLPDNVATSKPNVDSSEGSVDNLEPKSFKYSVGQKVRLHFYGGEVSTITEAFYDGWKRQYKVKSHPCSIWNEHDLDPYEEPQPSESTATKQETNSFQYGNTSNYSESLNSSQPVTDSHTFDHFADVRNMIDTRLHIATNVLGDIIKSQYYSLSEDCREENISEMAEVSVRLADALIAECESSTESLCSAKKGGSDA